MDDFDMTLSCGVGTRQGFAINRTTSEGEVESAVILTGGSLMGSDAIETRWQEGVAAVIGVNPKRRTTEYPQSVVG